MRIGEDEVAELLSKGLISEQIAGRLYMAIEDETAVIMTTTDQGTLRFEMTSEYQAKKKCQT